MKAMGYSSKVVTDATLDSTTGNITVSKIENGTSGSSTLDLASIYAKKTDLISIENISFQDLADNDHDVIKFARDVTCKASDPYNIGRDEYDHGGIRTFSNIVRNEKQLYFTWGLSQSGYFCFKIQTVGTDSVGKLYNIQYKAGNGGYIGGQIWKMDDVAYFIVTGDASNIDAGWSTSFNYGMCIVYKYNSATKDKTFYGIMSFGELIHIAGIEGINEYSFYAVPITNCSVFNFCSEA